MCSSLVRCSVLSGLGACGTGVAVSGFRTNFGCEFTTRCLKDVLGPHFGARGGIGVVLNPQGQDR